MRTPSLTKASGFTLVELMVVIVIIAVISSLVMVNIGGTEQRKAMQAREFLILELQKINREANDQGRIYALQTHAATDVADFGYTLLQYQQPAVRTAVNGQLAAQREKWQPVKDFKIKTMPPKVSFVVQETEHRFEHANNSDLIGQNAPTLIWFGNGEAKPVTIQVYYQQQTIGEPIRMDYLGQIDAQD